MFVKKEAVSTKHTHTHAYAHAGPCVWCIPAPNSRNNSVRSLASGSNASSARRSGSDRDYGRSASIGSGSSTASSLVIGSSISRWLQVLMKNSLTLQALALGVGQGLLLGLRTGARLPGERVCLLVRKR